MKAVRRFRWRLAALLAALATASASADIGILPAFVEVTLDRGRPSGRFEVSNVGDTPEHFRIQATHFGFTRDGALRTMAPDDDSLAPYITFNPKELVLAPKTRQTVRFVILVPPNKLRAGEMWAAMQLESLDVAQSSATDNFGRTIKLDVVASVMAPIFGQSGRMAAAAEFTSATIRQTPQADVVECLVRNTGNSRLLLKGKYQLLGADGKPTAEGDCGYGYVLPRSERVFLTPMVGAVSQGQYQLRVTYTAPQMKTPLTRQESIELKNVERKATTQSSQPASTRPANENTSAQPVPECLPELLGLALGPLRLRPF